MLFLKAFSWKTDVLTMLGDFVVKKPQNWEGKSVFNWESIIKKKRNVVCIR